MRRILFNGKKLLMLVATSSLFLSSPLKAVPWLPESWQTETVKTQNQQTNLFQGMFASYEGVDGTFGVQDESCFLEDFAEITGGNSTAANGSNTAWTGNANFPTVDRAFQAGGAVRIGASANVGFIESKELTDVEGDITVNIKVKGWSNIEGQLKVSIDGQSQTLAYAAVMADPFEQVTATFTGVTAGSKLKIETTAKRAFIDEVEIMCEEEDAPVTYSNLEIGTGTLTNRFPLGSYFGYERAASFYSSAELGAIQGTNIAKIAWFANATNNDNPPTKIYLKTITGNMPNTTWANITAGATLVYEGNLAVPTPNDWIEVELNTPFTYSGDNLLVLVERNYGGGGGSAGSSNPAIRYSTFANGQQNWLADTNPPTGSGSMNSNRPNIRITYAVAGNCSGTPEAGTVSSPASVNPGTTYSVTASGYTVANGLSFQWQSNTNGAGWVDEGAATNMYEAHTTTASTTVGDAVEWRLKVNCGASNFAYSTTSTTTVNLVYCTPVSTSTSDYLSLVSSTGAIANVNYTATAQAPGGYSDQTAQVLQFMPGAEFTMNTTYVGGANGVKIWVDWNKNGIFEASEVWGYKANSDLSKTFDLTAPMVAAGNYTMRVRAQYGSTANPDPCASISWGTAVDFTVNVLPLPACTGTPDAGVAAVNPAAGNPGSTYTVSATGYEVASGLTFQWQSNTNGAGWVNEGTATTEYAAYTATAPANVGDVVEWQLVVTCTNGGASATSDVATFTTELVYCTPTAADNDATGITYVEFNTITNTSGTTGAYTDYSSISTIVEAGESYDLSVKVNTSGNWTVKTKAWIDWNQDGVFDVNTEEYDLGSAVNVADGLTSLSPLNITVPAGQAAGNYKLRIRAVFGTTANPNPCTAQSYSEAEDYTLVIEEEEPEEPIIYCNPGGTNSSYFVNNFSTTGGAANISNLNSGFSTGGYGDFFDTHAVSQLPGQSVNFSVSFGASTSSTFGFRIWVDWNRDGIFADDEVAYASTGYNTSFNGTITVPAGAEAGTTRMRIVAHWLNQTGQIDPCETNHTYGEFEDYKFIVGELDPCSGTPEAGTVSVAPAVGNPGSTYTVSATGFTMASGLTFQWQSNTDGAGWVNEGVATSLYGDYTATAPATVGSTVDWKLVVTCLSSTQSVDSTVDTFTTQITYCTPVSSSSGDYISNFSTTGGVNNISNLNSGMSGTGYGDFYNTMGASVLPETPLNFNATYVGGSSGFRIWVDFNGNGTFEASEMLYSASTASATHNGSITVPAGTPAGDYRMRIRAQWSNVDVDPCAPITWGEAEDYKLTVLEMTDCSGTPEAGTVTVTPAQGAPGSNYTVSASGFTVANGLTYQWQSNTDGAGWVNEGAASSTYAAYTATAPATLGITVNWKLIVTCTASGDPAESNTANFTTALVYCEPTSDCSDGDVITNVTFEQINNDTSCSPNGYGDYTHLIAGVEAGQTYPIEVTVGDGWFERVSVWIDFGNDGSFDAEDYMGEVGDGGQGDTLFGDIQIPANVQPGQYRMRIAVGAVGSSNPAPSDPCAPHVFGETEDYTVQVTALGVSDLSSFDFSYYPNPVKDVLNISTKKEVKDVSVFNLTGQKVISNAKVSQGQINVSTLTPGTYVFRVTLEGGQVETFKIIKK